MSSETVPSSLASEKPGPDGSLTGDILPSPPSSATILNTAIDKEFLAMNKTFFALNVTFRNYKDKLNVVAQKHRGRRSHINVKELNLLDDTLAAVHALLNTNMQDLRFLRLNSSLRVLVDVSKRLALIQEGIHCIGHRLNAVEAIDGLDVALIRLEWREARHSMLREVYSSPQMTNMCKQPDVHAFTLAMVKLPHIYNDSRRFEKQQWPEQMREIEASAKCPICTHALHAPVEEVEGCPPGLAPGIISGECCQQPFHLSCLMPWLQDKRGNSDCPLCRKAWDFDEMEGMIVSRITEMEEIENGWQNWINRR
ncbi:RING-box protein 1 [Cladophialophora chaetospira]|uniref:Anaphase-promoting complex subunit 11 n=1 Tax=Cladophialophora chaetospira TaxID=386627 RepID=A0AA38X1B4_9EURO|nr:RING-box protein 1 [Cladophialophora chaetospira]